jgi:hypothetical protein
VIDNEKPWEKPKPPQLKFKKNNKLKKLEEKIRKLREKEMRKKKKKDTLHTDFSNIYNLGSDLSYDARNRKL